MKLTIVSASSTEWAPLNALTFPNKQEYAGKWSHNILHFLHPPDCAIAWDRVRVWREALEQVAPGDWIWFLGADTLIMNHTIRWESLFPFQGDLVIGRDINGINSDSFFLRNCPEAFDFLAKVVKLRQIIKNEQEAMTVVIALEIIRAEIRPQRQFNSYIYKLYPEYADDGGGSYEPGDLVLHIPGLDLPRKSAVIRKYLPRVVREEGANPPSASP